MPKPPTNGYDNSGQAFEADLDAVFGRDNELDENPKGEDNDPESVHG